MDKQSFAVLSSPTTRSTGTVTAPRVGASLVRHGQLAVLFGGASHEGGCSKALDTLDTESGLWQSIIQSSTAPWPQQRYDHLTVRIVRKGTPFMLVFGGASEDGLLSDLWLLNLVTWKWIDCSKICKGTAPSPRTIQFCGKAESVFLRIQSTVAARPLHAAHSNPGQCREQNSAFIDLRRDLQQQPNRNTVDKSRCGHVMLATHSDSLIVSGGMRRTGSTAADVSVLDSVWKLQLGYGDAGLELEWRHLEIVLSLGNSGSESTVGIDDGAGVAAIDAAASARAAESKIEDVAKAATNEIFDGLGGSSVSPGTKEKAAVLYFGGMDLKRVTNSVRILSGF
ncbi:hypothetical protein BJ741DRAFT_715986 [Chytriomyces cf. hyalinus JEL632]|nr:hypothetical protein BJ741DRAFT_715986 [Chytriomyces cf. hyalinus JEL632]